MYPNLDEYELFENVGNCPIVLCWPSEGDSFEMTLDEFIKAYPYHKI